MIFLHSSDGYYYTAEGNFQIKNDMPAYSYHIPYTAQNYAKSLGVNLQELGIEVFQATRTTIPWHKIDKVSFNNWGTYQVVFATTSLGFIEPPPGWTYAMQLALLVSPLRYGAGHTSAEVWGKTSVSVSTDGNYTAPAKLTYKGAQYYFPLDMDLKAHTGDAINYTRSGSLTYNDVSYGENEPVFDEGLYFNGNENSIITEDDVLADYTIFFLLRWKGDTAYGGTILKTNKFSIDWTDATHITLHGTADQTITFPQSDYENGSPVAIIITHKSDGTTNFICGVYDTTSETITTPANVNFTDAGLNDITGSVYAGYDGATSHISEHSISDLTIYEYEVPNASTAEWYLTMEPLRWNDFYLANITAGTITYQDGKLTDQDGNDITGLISGAPLVEGDIEKKAGLSGLWSVECDDTYLP